MLLVTMLLKNIRQLSLLGNNLGTIMTANNNHTVDTSITAQAKKPSSQEGIKLASHYLKGQIVEDLNNSDPFVSDESYELLKFHGSYQGYDRDTATARKKQGLDKEWEFMLRMKCPGGVLSAEQYLVLDDIAEKYANGTLRITTRQTFQFHCIVKNNLKKHIAAINEILLSTLGGCGDVVRNVMCSAAPIKDKIYTKLLEDTYKVAEFCTPKTSAYHEIWLDEENVARPIEEVAGTETAANLEGFSGANDVKSLSQSLAAEAGNYEPLYGKFYLPRKFKIGLATPEDNTIDVLTHDLAIVLIYSGAEFVGYNICLGGGLGMTHNKPETYPRLATPIAFVGPDELLRAVEAVVKLTRDHGDRSNRKHARLKYVVEENGVEWTKNTLDQYFGRVLEPAKPMGEFKVPDHMGWHDQKDGKLFLGIVVSSGRIVDRPDERVRSGLKAVIAKYKPTIRLTADQNIILADIKPVDQAAITEDLKFYGIKLAEDLTKVYKNFLACVALPTCGKALAEAERVKLPLVAAIENVMQKHGILKEAITIRIAGCPNGCSRPYVGDIGIVGRTPDSYAIFIGGDAAGTRLNTKILDRVAYEKLPDLFDNLFAAYVKERNNNEAFGDFAHRVGELKLGQEVANDLGLK